MALLEVSNLDVRFALRQGEVRALRDVSFTLDRGERLGIVGESGAGKSVAAFTLLNLIAKPGYIAGGSIRFEGKDLNRMSSRELRKVRGNRISMIFQDPMMTLNPVLSIGDQMVESLKAHRRISTQRSARDRLGQAQAGLHSLARDPAGSISPRAFRRDASSVSSSPSPCCWIPTSSWPTSPPRPST